MKQRAEHERNDRGPSRRRLAVGVALLTASVATLVPAVMASAADNKVPKRTETLPAGSMVSVADQIGARTVWQAGHTGEGINVAVIDTGAAVVPALSGPNKIIATVDLSTEASVNDARFLDTYGHGTHIAGIIAGRDQDADPTATDVDPTKFLGIAPDAGLITIKTADNSGMVDVSQIIAAIDWTVDHRDELAIRVLNLSYGTDSTQSYQVDPMAKAVERAWDAGIVVVTSVGNDGRSARRLANPASDPYVIAVAAAEPQGKVGPKGTNWLIPKWSSSGDGTRNPDVSAPGVSIESLRAPGTRIDLEHPEGYVNETLFKGSGSSQAAAVVSGAAALLLSARPELTPDQVKYLLMNTALPFKAGHQPQYSGKGVIQVDDAVAGTLTTGVSKLPSKKAAQPGPAQTWKKSTGTGTLEASRGSSHVIVNGMELTGETTVIGTPWRGQATTPTWLDDLVGHTWRGDVWLHSYWNGRNWAGDSWAGIAYNPPVAAPTDSWGSSLSVDTGTSSGTWVGKTWRDGSWDGKTWREASWDGKTWRDYEWLGMAWRVGTWS